MTRRTRARSRWWIGTTGVVAATAFAALVPTAAHAVTVNTVYSDTTLTVTFGNDQGTDSWGLASWTDTGEFQVIGVDVWTPEQTVSFTFDCAEDGAWSISNGAGERLIVSAVIFFESAPSGELVETNVPFEVSRCGDDTPEEENPEPEAPEPETPETEAPVVQPPVQGGENSAAVVAPGGESAEVLAATGASEATPLWAAAGLLMVALGAVLRRRTAPRT